MVFNQKILFLIKNEFRTNLFVCFIIVQSRFIIVKLYYRIRADESAGCGAVSEIGDGALLATKFHYSYNVSAFFGPICANGKNT